MKRPAGVIVSGVLAILGSALCLLSGAMMLLVLPMAQAQAPGLPRGFMYLPVAMMLAFGAWGLISGIGLIALKGWARISTLIFAGVLVTLAAMGLPFMLLMPMAPPPNQQVDEAMMKSIQMTMVLFYLAMGLVGAGWLVYFNRARVKEAFRGGAPEAPPNPNPLSIRIIAWLMVTSAPCGLLILAMPTPAIMVGGQMFTGPLATTITFVMFAIFFAIGLGLLKLQRWSHMAAMCIYALVIINTTVFWLQPGAYQRMQEAIRLSAQSMTLPNAQQTPWIPSLGFFIATGLLSGALPLYFLILRREKYLAAADAKAGVSRGETLP